MARRPPADRGPASAELQRVFFQDWAFATGSRIPPDGYFPRDDGSAGDATVAIVPSGPDTRTEAIQRLFFGAITGATREVAITTPYFVPTERCAWRWSWRRCAAST